MHEKNGQEKSFPNEKYIVFLLQDVCGQFLLLRMSLVALMFLFLFIYRSEKISQKILLKMLLSFLLKLHR